MIRNGNKQHEHMTAMPDKYPQGRFADKACRWCEELFSPQGPSHLYCCDNCKDQAANDKYYRKMYNISFVEVQTMLEKQNYKCAICKREGFKMRECHTSPLNLDHCHNTGVVRGLLCHNCNRALGLFADNTENLRNAINYLESATTIRKE